MYQAIGRGIYLFEVRKKAMNLHNDDASDIEPTKAIIKIQAVSLFVHIIITNTHVFNELLLY